MAKLLEPPTAKNRGLIDACKWADAFTDASRVALVIALRGGEECVSKMAATVGIDVVNTSHHLGVLRTAGVCTSRKEGRTVLYKLADADHDPSRNTLTLRHPTGLTVVLPTGFEP